jgi:ketosteroid isomerase-like protein
MSSENAKVVRRSFDAYAAGGIEAALPFYDPDFVWDPGPEWVEDDIYRGHDGARRLDAIFLESFENYDLELHDIRSVGADVVALYEAKGRIKGSNVPLRQPMGIVASEFRGGRIGLIRSFFSWRQALESVGLTE